MLSSVRPLLVLLCAFAFAPSLAASPANAKLDPATKCGVKKLNETATLAKKTLSCHKKAAKSGFPVDATCLNKAEARFLKKFPTTEPCALSDDTNQASANVADAVEDLVALTHPVVQRSKCDTKLLAALAKAADGIVRGEAKFLKTGRLDKRSKARQKASSLLVKEVTIASARGDCGAPTVDPVELFDRIVEMVDGSDAPLCGDGVLDPGEFCDDGNTVDDETCGATCGPVGCGDGIIQAGEECDDGNTVGGDGCRPSCSLEVCGDGVLDPGEFCDDGNTVDGDGCGAGCGPISCGDGIVDMVEECDDGNTVGGDGCRPSCTLEVCGDGIIDAPGEQCDDGNTSTGDGCSADCQPNGAPIAAPDELTVMKLTSGTVQPLSNDEDPEGTSLSLVGFDATSVEAGTITEEGAETLRYQPAEGFVGVDSFEYLVGDGATESTGTVEIRVLPFAQELSPANLVAGGFGADLAIDGDRAIVGASADGIAYVLVLTEDGTWDLEQQLTGEGDAGPGDNFAASVDLDGDTAVVGAPFAGVGGRAFVFERSGGTWSRTQLIEPNADFANAGEAVAVDGDRIAIGANSQDLSIPHVEGAGAVLVWQRLGGVWQPDEALRSPTPGEFARFGDSVALQGEELIVGESAANDFDGAVHVFNRTASGWEHTQELSGDPEEQLGTDVALDGDRMVAGAPFSEREFGIERGAAYAFVRSGPGWSLDADLRAEGSQRLGYSVALHADRAVVGSEGSRVELPLPDQAFDEFDPWPGAYVFSTRASGWGLDEVVHSRPGFGAGVAISNDFVALGVPGADHDGRSGVGTALFRWARRDGAEAVDSNQYLAFPGMPDAETSQTAAAYYAAIDPTSAKTTLPAWYAQNGFDAGAADRGADAFAIYGNEADLGFGRRMALRDNGGSIASCVENFPSVTDAVNESGLAATVCMEYSATPGSSVAGAYTKFWVFGADGSRLDAVDLDGRGDKYVPGACNVCHGGVPRPLDPGGIYPNDGRTGAGFLPWDLDNFSFASEPGLGRGDQEEEFRKLNAAVLQTDSTATSKGLVDEWYGGAPETPGQTFDGSFVPASWAGNSTLYRDVVAPDCRVCHMQRSFDVTTAEAGSANLDLSSEAGWTALGAPHTSRHVFDSGLMPLALRTFQNFWGDETKAVDVGTSSPALLGRLDASGNPDRPGRPVADIGPDGLTVPLGTIRLSAARSSYASVYRWRITPPGGEPSLLARYEPTLELDVNTLGKWVIEVLIARDGSVAIDGDLMVLNVTSDPLDAPTFSNVEVALGLCAGCHSAAGVNLIQPLDLATIPGRHTRVTSRVDPGGLLTSRLLMKPSLWLAHQGGLLFEEGDEDFDLIYRWIAEGSPDD